MQNTTDRNTGADKLKIGIYGGAFNPVHNGHLELAGYYYDVLGLDKLIFIPTADPPHKSSENFARAEDRLNMLLLAVKDKEGFEVSDIEYRREGKSYTYLTLCELKELYPDSEFYLIIGADQLFIFDSWYRYRDILDTVTLCTAARDNEAEREKMLSYAKSLDGLDMQRFFLSDKKVYRISSSEIREIIKAGGDASAHLPSAVYEYIKEKGLYIA